MARALLRRRVMSGSGITPSVATEARADAHEETLASWIARRGRLSLGETRSVIHALARELTAVHAAGRAHGAITPDRVLVMHDARGTRARLTSSAPIVLEAEAFAEASETPVYMSPEAALGDTIDARSDSFQLGLLAFTCATGVPALVASSVREVVTRVCLDPMPVPSTIAPVAPGFDAWFARATTRAPSDRFPSARELADALERAPRVDPRRARPTRTSSVGIVAAPAFLVALGAALLWADFGGSPALAAPLDDRAPVSDAGRELARSSLALREDPPTRAAPASPTRPEARRPRAHHAPSADDLGF